MTELGNQLAEAVGRLFQSSSAVDTAEGWSKELWNQLDAMSINLTLVDENHGGGSGGWIDAFFVLELVGLHSVPLPVAENILALKLLATADIAILPGVYTISTNTSGTWKAENGGYSFTGELVAVPWGRYADHVLCVEESQSSVRVHLLPRAAARIAPAANLAGEPRDRLSFSGVPSISAVGACVEANRLFEFCTLARLPLIAGGLVAVLNRSIQHAVERKQFGRAIGQFQAIQQQLAQLGSETAAVSCAARAACRAADRGDPSFQIAAAKLRANQAIGLATAIAHQVHGAVGFTQDHPLHRVTQRLWSWRSELGNDRYWSERLGALVTRAGPASFWSDLTARDDAVG